MKTRIVPLIAALVLTPVAALAADTPAPPPEPTKDAVIEDARAALQQKDWKRAQALLQDGVARNPGSADYHNLYAYSIRKGASPDMNLVFKHYNEALRLNPEHRGAHEYIGEAYLMVGNLPKAKEHLGTLDKLCLLPCQEYTDLKKAVAQFESKQAAR